MTVAVPTVASSPPSDAPRRWVEPLLILAFWTVMAALTAIGHLVNQGRSSLTLTPAFPAASVGLAFVMSYLWAALTPLIFRLSRRYRIERAKWFSRVLILLAIGVLVAIAFEIVGAYLRFEVFFSVPDPDFAFRPFFGLARLFWLDDFVVRKRASACVTRARARA